MRLKACRLLQEGCVGGVRREEWVGGACSQGWEPLDLKHRPEFQASCSTSCFIEACDMF